MCLDDTLEYRVCIDRQTYTQGKTNSLNFPLCVIPKKKFAIVLDQTSVHALNI